MTITFNALAEMDHPIFRNIQGIRLGYDEFDDLTTDPKAKRYAHRLSSAYKANLDLDELQYHAIDFIFKQHSWSSSRFSNGTYPVWYGSVNLNTSFYETLYHWRKVYLEAPHDFIKSDKTIKTLRTVFTVVCNAALIDLRANKDELLAHPNPERYPYTQQIGLKIHQAGYPGLISKSARDNKGEITAIFKKEILSSPEHYDNYIYEFDIEKSKTLVKLTDSNKVVLSI